MSKTGVCGCCFECDQCGGFQTCPLSCDHRHYACSCDQRAVSVLVPNARASVIVHDPSAVVVGIVDRDRALAEQIVALIGRDSIGLPARKIVELCDKIGRAE